MLLLPVDPDASARAIAAGVRERDRTHRRRHPQRHARPTVARGPDRRRHRRRGGARARRPARPSGCRGQAAARSRCRASPTSSPPRATSSRARRADAPWPSSADSATSSARSTSPVRAAIVRPAERDLFRLGTEEAIAEGRAAGVEAGRAEARAAAHAEGYAAGLIAGRAVGSAAGRAIGWSEGFAAATMSRGPATADVHATTTTRRRSRPTPSRRADGSTHDRLDAGDPGQGPRRGEVAARAGGDPVGATRTRPRVRAGHDRCGPGGRVGPSHHRGHRRGRPRRAPAGRRRGAARGGRAPDSAPRSRSGSSPHAPTARSRSACCSATCPPCTPTSSTPRSAPPSRHPLAFVRDADGTGTTLATARAGAAFTPRVRRPIRPRSTSQPASPSWPSASDAIAPSVARTSTRSRRSKACSPASATTRPRPSPRSRTTSSPLTDHRPPRKGIIMTLTLGYKASAEQFAPRELVEIAVAAEGHGMESVWTSDHFQPWRHTGGHAPFSLTWMAAVGERTSTIRIGTSVMTPTFRYNPAVLAQAFASLGCLYPDRVLAGFGTGEALNEIATGFRGAGEQDWPEFKERYRAAARGGAAHARALGRGPRELRGRVLLDARRLDLRPPRGRRADLHRRGRAHGREVRGPRGRRLHLHLRQGRGAVRRPAHAGRARGRWRPRASRSTRTTA